MEEIVKVLRLCLDNIDDNNYKLELHSLLKRHNLVPFTGKHLDLDERNLRRTIEYMDDTSDQYIISSYLEEVVKLGCNYKGTRKIKVSYAVNYKTIPGELEVDYCDCIICKTKRVIEDLDSSASIVRRYRRELNETST
jgi:ferredoxin-like protein FixX